MKHLFSFLIIFFLLGLFCFTQSTYALSLDQTFGINGLVITQFGNDSSISHAIMQSDGKVVAVGNSSNGSNLDWAIVRYNTNGSLDTNFGNNGIILRDFGNDDSLQAALIQSDGKIIVAGFTKPIGNYLWTIARYNSNGTVDNTFGTNGIVTTTFSSNLSLVKDIALQTDGKIIAVGYANNGVNDDIAIARYNSNGSIDTSFGNSGIVMTGVGISNDRGNAISIQPDGKFIIFGDFDAGGHDSIFLIKYNLNGSVDTSFGNNGLITTQIGTSDGGSSLKTQLDGKILVTGGTVNNGSLDTYLVRYNLNGSLDNTFGTNGIVTHSFSANNDSSNSLAIQTDGKILLGGSEDNAAGSGIDFILSRFNNDGSLDLSFGNNGSFIKPVSSGSGSDSIQSLVLQSDNKLIAAGYSSNGTFNVWTLIRITDLNTGPSSVLNVPYFSQNALPWGTQEYDHSGSLGFASPFMNRWGCAVTSAAMVLRYYNINQLANGTPIDPGSLNTWLNSRTDGYVTGYGSDGSYSYLNWSAISALTRDLFAAGKAPVKLEYQGLQTNTANFSTVNAILDDDLQNKNMPDILWVHNALTSGHFIVAKGKLGSVYSINDPEWNYPTLSSFNNTYMQLGRYIPSHTDLSYLVFVVNPSVDLLLTNVDGYKSGAFWDQGVKKTYNELTDVNYGFQAPLSNPNGANTPESLGTGENVLTFPKLSDGNYTITLSSKNLQPFTANFITYEQNGDSSVKKMYGFTDKGNGVSLPFTYSQSQQSIFTPTQITFATTITDIKESDSAHLINHIVALGLIQMVQTSQKLSSQGKKIPAQLLLDQTIATVNISKKLISPVAYQLILTDLNTLRQSL